MVIMTGIVAIYYVFTSIIYQGVGHGMVIMTGIVAIYYNVILSWAIYYLVMSFNTVLPWSSCDNSWNTDSCYLRIRNATNITTTDLNTTMDHTFGLNTTAVTDAEINIPYEIVKNISSRRTPTEEFWE